MNRADCEALDAADPLRPHRAAFALPDGVIYLDGNSLGPLPRATAARVREVVEDEWGEELIRAWNSADWIGQPRRVGDKIARLIGARPGEVVAADSTSINLYKVLGAALALARAEAPARTRIVSERTNFPTDLYIAQGLAAANGAELDLLRDSGTTICACPTTEADLGDGFLPAVRVRHRAIPLCIGSDSNVRIDPFEELRELEGIGRRQEGRRGILTTDELWQVGGASGAAALGLDSWASIEIDLDHASLDGIARDDLRAALLAGCAADVVVPG